MELFLWLTAHRRPPSLEYVVKALLLTLVVRVLATAYRSMSVFVADQVFQIGVWSEGIETFADLLFAALLGAFLAYIFNKGWVGEILFRAKLTKNDHYPSQWYSAFSRYERYVTLHLNDGRLVQGWPDRFPDMQGTDCFILTRPEWVGEDMGRTPMETTKALLVPAKGVHLVEFMFDEGEKQYSLFSESDGSARSGAGKEMTE